MWLKGYEKDKIIPTFGAKPAKITSDRPDNSVILTFESDLKPEDEIVITSTVGLMEDKIKLKADDFKEGSG
jgi:hypothetical protein